MVKKNKEGSVQVIIHSATFDNNNICKPSEVQSLTFGHYGGNHITLIIGNKEHIISSNQIKKVLGMFDAIIKAEKKETAKRKRTMKIINKR